MVINTAVYVCIFVLNISEVVPNVGGERKGGRTVPQALGECVYANAMFMLCGTDWPPLQFRYKLKALTASVMKHCKFIPEVSEK